MGKTGREKGSRKEKNGMDKTEDTVRRREKKIDGKKQ